MNHSLALEDLDQRIELQIAAWRYRVLISGFLRFVFLPLSHVILGFGKSFADGLFDTHSSRRVSSNGAPSSLIVGLFGVFTKRELDTLWGIGNKPLINRLPYLPLYDCVLTANGVRRPVKYVSGCRSASKLSVN